MNSSTHPKFNLRTTNDPRVIPNLEYCLNAALDVLVERECNQSQGIPIAETVLPHRVEQIDYLIEQIGTALGYTCRAPGIIKIFKRKKLLSSARKIGEDCIPCNKPTPCIHYNCDYFCPVCSYSPCICEE